MVSQLGKDVPAGHSAHGMFTTTRWPWQALPGRRPISTETGIAHMHGWLRSWGAKIWTVFPPDQYSLLFNKNFEPGAQPWVNIANPNLETFPRFKEATPIEFVLHPGEFLFVPSGWVHQVTSLDATISLSGNYVDGSNIAPLPQGCTG